MLALNVVALAFVLLHAVTWFNLAPKAMVIRMRGRRIPPRSVAAAHFTAWAVASAVWPGSCWAGCDGQAVTSEAVAWLLFSAGGMASALLVPVLLLLFGVVFPLGLLAPPEHAYLLAVLGHPLTRLVLLVLCVLSLLHWAHRFRYTLYDGLQLRRLSKPIILLCYVAAVAGSVWAAVVLFG